jgi:hypothetical protein
MHELIYSETPELHTSALEPENESWPFAISGG